MPIDTAVVRRGVVAVAGLLASAVMVLAGCGTTDEITVTTDSASGTPPSAPMDTPAPAMTDDNTADDSAADDEAADADAAEQPDLAPGIYRAYSAEALAEPGYETRVIFFHASWCPECRAFEQSIEAGPIPDGVQILKADYDTESELKDKYDVSIQTTFVKVDENGGMISSWIGYDQDRSIDNLLDQLG